MNFLKIKFLQQNLKKLASLQLAIYLLFIIGILIGIGTVIEQDQPLSFYQENYPENNAILSFINWKFILLFQLNEIYNSYWFFLILVFFGATLISCTFTTQLPSLKKFRLWRFIKDYERLNQFGSNETFVKLSTNSIFYLLNIKNYHTFRQAEKNYAYSGLLGRFAPIVVHFSILLLLFGSSVGLLCGYTAQEIVPRGEIFHVQNLIKSGNFSNVSQNLSWRINDFWITYTKEFKTNQFYSDLSLLDISGNEIKRKTIFVNEPFVYNGLTLYQTDWNIIGIKFRLNDGDKIVQVPLKKISKDGRNFWFGSLPLENIKKEKFSLVINDLRGNIFIYDKKGNLVSECQLGQTLFINKNQSITLYDFITSTGLQIKIDPGLRIVYLSFFLLICSTYISFVSYSQIWGIEKKNRLFLAGTSNRAVLYFQEEFRKIKYKISLTKT